MEWREMPVGASGSAKIWSLPKRRVFSRGKCGQNNVLWGSPLLPKPYLTLSSFLLRLGNMGGFMLGYIKREQRSCEVWRTMTRIGNKDLASSRSKVRITMRTTIVTGQKNGSFLNPSTLFVRFRHSEGYPAEIFFPVKPCLILWTRAVLDLLHLKVH